MKPLKILVLSAVVAFAAVGCQSPLSPAKVDAESTILQSVLDAVFPSDFQGDASFRHARQSFTVDVRVGGLRKRSDGRWTWTWLDYKRTSNFPVFYGTQIASTGELKMGPVPPR